MKHARIAKLLCVLALVIPSLVAWNSAAVAGKSPHALKGKRFALKVIDGSFTVPKGWSAKETEDGIQLSHPRFTNSAIALGVNTLTPAQQTTRIDALVWQTARDALGELSLKELRAPVASELHSNPIASLILHGPINGTEYRARVGAIQLGSQLMVFIAMYPASDELVIGPVFDTAMVSFRGRETPPRAQVVKQPSATSQHQTTQAKVNRKLTQQVLGCWRYRTSTGGSTGSSNTTKRFFFDANGTYTYSYRLFVSTPYGSSKDSDDDDGRYSVAGSTVHFTSNDNAKEDSTMSVRVANGFLFVGDTRYIPCE